MKMIQLMSFDFTLGVLFESFQSKAIRNRIKTSAFRLTAGFCFKYFLNYNLFNFFAVEGIFVVIVIGFQKKVPYLCFSYDNLVFLACGAQKYDDIALESCLIVLFLNFAPKQEFSFSNRSSRIFLNEISLNYAEIAKIRF